MPGRSFGLETPRNLFFHNAIMLVEDQGLQNEVSGLIVSTLNLDIAPEAIQLDAPLYGEGLGLDSIDILEVALVVSKRYGFQLRADSEDNVRIFSSLRSLTQHIAQHRAK